MLKSEGRELRLLLLLVLPPVVELEEDEVDEDVEEARLLAESLAALEEFDYFHHVIIHGLTSI